MFFAFNNGITATAEEVETKEIDGVLSVTRLKNLQIVNGGQTTASIHAASRSRSTDLSRVFVQMKLSIVKPERAEEVVPKISEYANSQNKVNAADFFANHPFHLEMEKMSRRIPAPSPGGGFTQSKWFYERARGQYADARGRFSESQRRKYDIEYPRASINLRGRLTIRITRGYGMRSAVIAQLLVRSMRSRQPAIRREHNAASS